MFEGRAPKCCLVHGLYLAKETVRKLMTQAGLWIPRKLRPPRVHQPQPRRACTGELIQIDGCEHRWYEDRGPACMQLVYVDDATSRLMQLLFVSSESTFIYFEATRGYLERYGKPLAFYSDSVPIPVLPRAGDLNEIGETCAKNRVDRIMQLNRIKAVRGYKAPRRIAGRPSVVAPNRVQRQFTVVRANQVWVTDITYSVPGVQGEHGCSNEPRVCLEY